MIKFYKRDSLLDVFNLIVTVQKRLYFMKKTYNGELKMKVNTFVKDNEYYVKIKYEQ